MICISESTESYIPLHTMRTLSALTVARSWKHKFNHTWMKRLECRVANVDVYLLCPHMARPNDVSMLHSRLCGHIFVMGVLCAFFFFWGDVDWRVVNANTTRSMQLLDTTERTQSISVRTYSVRGITSDDGLVALCVVVSSVNRMHTVGLSPTRRGVSLSADDNSPLTINYTE